MQRSMGRSRSKSRSKSRSSREDAEDEEDEEGGVVRPDLIYISTPAHMLSGETPHCLVIPSAKVYTLPWT